MTTAGRHKANAWPYPRHGDYVDGLRSAAAAWLAARGYRVSPRYPYILADRDDWPRNIILPEVVDYVQREKRRRKAQGTGFPLHKYLHHGLSSQAMWFNLAGPLIVRGDLAPLQAAFSAAGIAWPGPHVHAALECEDRAVFHEDYGQPTSIDLSLQGEPGSAPLFVEAKLVEPGFGGCSVFSEGDCDGRNPARQHDLCHLHHVGRTCWPLLARHGFLDGPLAAGPICPLASHYQFFRELLFALEKGGSFVLLYDARNPAFLCQGPAGRRGLLPLLSTLVPERLRCRVAVVSMQAVVQAVAATGRHGDWVEEFRAKYGL